MMSSWKHQLGPFGIFIGALLLPSAVHGPASDTAPSAPTLSWQPWSDSIFDQARREHKFVLLDLQAVWCHWCHVMDVKTYADPHVMELINSRYIAVRVDQDSRPDLASRYQDYGWPATVVFNSDGSEIVKRQGYLPPEEMSSMLQAIIDDPSPGPSVVNSKPISLTGLTPAADASGLKQQLLAGYDAKLGSWGTAQKFLNWDNVEYCLVQAQDDDAGAEKMARQTLDAQLKLIDPVWGGVDQYSAGDNWDHPHFEKIMQMQAENIRIYSEAYAQWKDPVYLKTAVGIYGYVREFLTSPEGVVYTSQDADLVPGEHAADYFELNDAQRRKLGIPRVDQHVYARENGWFIEALASLYATTGNACYRNEAVRAAEWVYRNRSTGDGGFRHGEEKDGPINLSDTLAMGRAFLSLYEVTSDGVWLDQASHASDFIDKNFTYRADGNAIGFASAANEPAANLFTPEPDFDENVSLARFANLLFHYTGNSRDRRVAETARRFAGSPVVAKSRLSSVGGLLLAMREMASDPLHIAIVGKKDDSAGHQLLVTALAFPYLYKQVERIDSSASSAAPDAIIYPTLPRSAAYICANHACSAPVFDTTRLTDLLTRRTAQK